MSSAHFKLEEIVSIFLIVSHVFFSCSVFSHQGKHGRSDNSKRDKCIDCGVGQYTPTSNALKCKTCSLGHYQKETGKTACLSCLPGKYGRADAANRIDCDDCKPGTASAESGRKEPCEESDVGTIVLGGGTTAVKVPEGS